jgi:hypothetical protein
MLRLEAERACLIALGAPETFLAVAGSSADVPRQPQRRVEASAADRKTLAS